jgi:glycosyltransferase involved in cell wall biosynthesis
MIRKSVYDQVAGMDEQEFKVSYNDIDLCLKVGAAGYLNVWTPHAVLLHEGSVSQKKVDPASLEAKRKRFAGEQDAMYAKWLPALASDPAYNRNLSLNGKGFEIEPDPGLTWRPLSWRPLPVVLAHPADPWGCGNYRIIKPFQALRDAALVDGMLSEGLLQVVDLQRYDPDVIVLQRQIGDERLEAMQRIKQFSRAFKVYELDDYLPNLPIKSFHKMPKDIIKSMRRGLSYVDRFVVSTAPLADALSGFHPDIRVIENRLPVEWWQGLSSRRQRGHKPRVGWAGGIGHRGDLELITDVIRELAGEVEWVFFGMCPEKIRPYVHEIHVGVDIDDYPAALAALDLDLALAPVEQNLFNDCKSNLRLLEYGACGYPVICSDVLCYRGDLPVTRVKNRFKDWVDAIRMHINDLDATARMGDELRAQVMDKWLLQGRNIEAWRAAWLPD